LDWFLRVREDADDDDSVLAAEARAVVALLSRMGCPETRLALIAYGGDVDPRTPDASIIVPPTADTNEVDSGLERLLLAGPNGLTNIAAALEAAHELFLAPTNELTDERRAHVLLLSDGLPTLPHLGDKQANARAALVGADRLAKAGVRIHTVAVGTEATDDPKVLRELAHVGGGAFVSAREPASLPIVLDSLEFAGVADVAIRNATTGSAPASIRRFADGCFGALLPVTEGRNQVEVVAHGSLGAGARSVVSLVVGGQIDPLPPRWSALRDTLIAGTGPSETSASPRPAAERSE
jgi:hypothetical protein